MIRKELLPWFEKMYKEEEDRQALITRGYKSLYSATYLLLQINKGKEEEAKTYLNGLIPFITNSKKEDKQLNNAGEPEEAINIAFTSGGLKRLGMPEDVLNTFSREFIEGMTHTYKKDATEIKERSTLLGDVGSNDPHWWQWLNDENDEHEQFRVDVGLFFYAASDVKLERLIQIHYEKKQQGVKLIKEAKTKELNSEKPLKEHFGFRDGISQPIIKGFSKSNSEPDDEKLINPGEFILGHINEYNDYSPSPCVPFKGPMNHDLPSLNFDLCSMDLGKNGTYLVFRQIEQHVERFLKYVYASKETAGTKMERAVKLASKMVGRWPEGQPLVTYPHGGCPMDRRSLNDFYYAEKDPDGTHCPLGAHIRRTNPRDQVHTGRDVKASLEMSKKHRILRRGRIYGEPLDEDFDIEKMIELAKPFIDTSTTGKIEPKRGLHFIALVSDIGRQFEFVQSVWANTSTFGDLCNEVDPVISPRPTGDQPDCHEFTTPQDTVRNRYKNVPMFTTVVGGAYFFLPGMNALRYILNGILPVAITSNDSKL